MLICAKVSKGEQTKQLIVSRAVALAHTLGLEQVTLGTLAADLELSKSGLYAHFKSKEALQLAVIAEVVDQFTKQVVLPAFSFPRGQPRLSAMFANYLRWMNSPARSTTGCILLSLTYEYDDRPGAVRDALLVAQRDWLDSLARVAKSAVDHGAFKASVDPRQFAFEFEGIAMSYQFALKVPVHARGAETMAQRAFADLLARCSP